MSDYFVDTTSFWAMLNQIDDGVNQIAEIFPEPRDQSEQRSGLGERLAARIEFNPPRLETDNISPFASFFRNSNDVSSPMVAISPGFSPSTLLQSPIMSSNPSLINPSTPVTNIEPQEVEESCGENNATTMMSETDLSHDEPMNVDLPPPQEGVNTIPTEESRVEPLHAPLVAPVEFEVVDHTNIMSMEEESEDEDYEEEDDDDDDDDDEDGDEDEDLVEEKDEVMVDKQDVKPSTPKRRKYEVSSNMVGASRASKTQRIIIQMESDEDQPNDGFRWRKYGQKVVKGNPNPRSYYKCTYEGCEVKKLVERGAEDFNVVVTTYDGIHQHNAPLPRSVPKTRPGSTMPSDQHQTNQTPLDTTTPSTSLAPQMDLTQLYMTGLSKLPSLPVHQNTSFMYRNDGPRIDAMSNGTNVLLKPPTLPVHRNTDFMYRNDEPRIDAMPNGTNVLLKPPGLHVHQNTGFMYQTDEPRIDAMPNGTNVLLEPPRLPVLPNTGFTYRNEELRIDAQLQSLPVHQNTDLMYRTDEPWIDAMPNGTNVLSKLPSLQDHQNTGFMYRTDEPRSDTTSNAGVYNGIMNRLLIGFGMRI